MDDHKFLIHVEIAGKEYGLWINRNDEHEEQLVREAARQIKNKLIQYRQHFSNSKIDVKDMLAMVTLQLSRENLQLEEQNDTSPFTEKLQQLISELEHYLKNT
ncbi:MAG: cell division protein ZapA [Tannerellaceae bacterium]|jgi:cell division protein ZapA|nr:cell division protein ZapA [Tannerellaceae bacterium]